MTADAVTPEPPPTDPNSGRSRDPNSPPFTKRFQVVDPSAPTEQDFEKLLDMMERYPPARTQVLAAFAAQEARIRELQAQSAEWERKYFERLMR